MSKENRSIGCTVSDCKYNCHDGNCCTLNKIDVGSCHCHPTEPEGTCCESFEEK